MTVSLRRTTFTLMLLAVGLSGCRLFLPLIPWLSEPTRDVPAEYPYLANRLACISVWADNDVLFEFPNVQYELAEHVSAAISEKVSVAFTPNREVVDLMARTPDWDRRHPSWLGKHFGADRVILIEVMEYTTREPGATHLLRGLIHATVKVYDPAYPNAAASYRSTIEVIEPKDEVAAYGVSENDIRRAVMESFAAEVAGKFYDRKVKVQ